VANAAGLTIQLGEISPETLRAHAALDRLCRTLDLSPYIFTTRVRIERDAASRSHPMLTLGAASASDPHLLLAEFLHQQMRWYLAGRGDRVANAGAAFATMFPTLAGDAAEATRPGSGIYRILAAAFLEHAALSRLIGADDAEDAVRSHASFRAVYRVLLRNSAAIAAVMEENELAPPGG